MLAIGLFIVTLCALGQPLTATGSGSDLQALCNGKKIPLTKLSQLGPLVSQLDQNGFSSDCEETASALSDLKYIVEANRNMECSMEAFENYKKFYMLYLDSSTIERREIVAKVAEPVRNLALAYGVQVSSLCRSKMVRVLIDEVPKVVPPEDFNELQDLVSRNGSVAKAIGFNKGRPDEIILLRDLMIGESSADASPKKMSLQVDTAPIMRRIQTLCERRYKKIYEALLVPVGKFANLGFDFRKGVLKEEIKEADKNEGTKDSVGRWTRVLFLCDVVDKVELVESEEDAKRSEGNSATLVTLVSNDDKAQNAAPANGKDLLKGAKIDVDDIKEVQFDIEPSVVIPDEIYSTSRQKKATKKVNTKVNEVHNARRRFVLALARSLLTDGGSHRYDKMIMHAAKGSGKQLMKLINQDKHSAANVQTDMILTLNQLVETELNAERAVSKGVREDKNSDPWFLLLLVSAIAVSIFVAFKHGAFAFLG